MDGNNLRQVPFSPFKRVRSGGMGLGYGWWLWLWKQISPEVDSRRVEEILAEARRSLPTPVFWMLGKVQQGKTSIIRALTGREDAEIGKGFRPCTRTSRVYAYPDEEGCFLRFLDTRGLGEVGYDPAEDLQVFAGQSHCVMVVIKAMDHAQQDVLRALQAIRKARPRWPVVVCQTTLHEGYAGDAEHPIPYPYAQEPLPDTAPSELARSLVVQRTWFEEEPVRFVPLDFTFADYGQRVYEPSDYGLDALWEALEAALPLGLREMVRTQHRRPPAFARHVFRRGPLAYSRICGGGRRSRRDSGAVHRRSRGFGGPSEAVSHDWSDLRSADERSADGHDRQRTGNRLCRPVRHPGTCQADSGSWGGLGHLGRVCDGEHLCPGDCAV